MNPSELFPGHLTTVRAGGRVLMKQPVYVFSAHGPNYWCLCTNPYSAGKPGGEVGCETQLGVLSGSSGMVKCLCPIRAGHQPLPMSGHDHHPLHWGHAAQQEPTPMQPEGHARPHLLDFGQV